jgi:hypothetical protein
MHIIDVPINWNILGNESVFPNAAYIVDNA